MTTDVVTRIKQSLPWAKSAEIENDSALIGVSDGAVVDASPLVEIADASADEQVLIAAAQQGDEQAFAELVAIHQPQVYALACRIVHDPDEADEIAQDVFLAAWRGLPNFRGEAKLATWLYRITYRRCLQTIEARQNRLTALSQLASLQFERLANTWNDMQATFAEQEWQQAIRDQIDALPIKYRMVLMLRHWQDLSYEEIAQQLTLPISTVKTHLFRARQLLGERLQTVQLPRVELPHMELPKVELPRVELPHVEMPKMEFPDVGQALRDRVDQIARNAGEFGELLRGHLQSEPRVLGQ